MRVNTKHTFAAWYEESGHKVLNEAQYVDYSHKHQPAAHKQHNVL